MSKRHYIAALLTAGCITGCKPSTVQNESANSNAAAIDSTVPQDPPSASIAHNENRSDARPSSPVASRDYIVLNQPWNEYFREPPKILILPEISQGIANILNEEQELIKAVLDSGAKASSTSEYVALQDRFEELKNIIPQAETSSGYVSRRYRSGSYSYISNGVIYTRSSRYYSDGYYSVFRHKQESSSPALTRSVESIAHNATLEDLDQRIDALQQILSNWNRKTCLMSVNGTAGIMRKANESYLKGLQEYTGEFLKIRKDFRVIEQKQEANVRNRANILARWQAFEETRLSILDEYLQANASDIIEATGKDTFEISAFSKKKLLYACAIGTRILYFDLSAQRSELHPFVLIDVDPVE